jgi:hypothetical protein
MFGATPSGDGAEMTCVGGDADGAGLGDGARPGSGSVGDEAKVSPGRGSVLGAEATTGGGGVSAAFGGGMTTLVLPGNGVEATTAGFIEPEGLTMSAFEGPTGRGLAATAASV